MTSRSISFLFASSLLVSSLAAHADEPAPPQKPQKLQALFGDLTGTKGAIARPDDDDDDDDDAPAADARNAPMQAAAAAKELALTAEQTKLVAMVKRNFLTKYQAQQEERSMYSRVAMPATARRVQINDTTAHTDADGGDFVAFTIDERRYGRDWKAGAMSGCVYPERGEVYVKVGDKLRHANAYLGKKAPKTPDGACTAKPAAVASR